MTAENSTRVRVGYEFTINLGNFENVKVKVEVEDSPRGNETTADAYARIDKFVSERVAKEVAEARSVAV